MASAERGSTATRLASLLEAVEGRDELPGAELVHDRHRRGAANLADDLAFRRHDLRALQGELARLGVSSLGRGEPHVRATLRAALRACCALADRPLPDVDGAAFDDGPAALEANAAALLGDPRPGRSVQIMVTLPSSAAEDGGALAEELIGAGMDCARVNTAHDGPDQWRAMVEGVRSAAERAGRGCTVLADLAGPKLRTGPLATGPQAVRIRPLRDAIGRTERPGTAVLHAPGVDVPPTGAVAVPVLGDLLAGLADGDALVVEEARGRSRTARVVEVDDGWATIEVSRTTWLATGGSLHRAATRRRPRASGTIGELPPRRTAIRLLEDDLLILTADLVPAAVPPPGEVARIGCTLPEALAALRPGHRVELDDGVIGAEVTSIDHDAGEAVLRITRTPVGGAKLRAEKGVNLPDSALAISALSDADRAALDAIGGDVDVIGLSFVRSPDDVRDLHDALDERALDVGVVLKIETPAAFRALPALLVAAMRHERAGVMIARGDLAVEAGFERTAELQEEILWACEAAHLPAIWATQVLESLAKEGQPSRAEITDAAMATRAECVMLNKGDHIVRAVSTLDDILRRMEGHQRKKATLLRQLRSW
jgi:pyruvate kinase